MRKEIAKLLETGQEATARIRVKHIIREENMMAAQEIVELFCELVTIWLPIIEAQRTREIELKKKQEEEEKAKEMELSTSEGK
ncbi:IST1 homolog isoform X2 [Macadamia integrifolia]|uniref:IST1 homolog isoform X2 n=1 Tax=Macadamia integrifolia TaxID=60698 RepID=UPI001C4E69A1|nr:IST1 homolog isoform X2 [Macadamia integrifolia]